MPHRKRSRPVPHLDECLARAATGGLHRLGDVDAQTSLICCPPLYSIFGQMTQCGAPAIAAHCIGHRSTLRGHMQRTAFSMHPLHPILCIRLPWEIPCAPLSPSEYFETKQDAPGGSAHEGHFCLRASICFWNLRTSLGWRSATLVCSPWSCVMRNSWGVGL